MMGNIVQTDDHTVALNVQLAAQAPIERVDFRNGAQVLQTLRGYDAGDLGNRFRIIWSGAEYRGRAKEELCAVAGLTLLTGGMRLYNTAGAAIVDAFGKTAE